ncbi:hypothetical protein F5B20DRAFT_582734 [Whalleya microplaca]|nr:hypothetical protein F5B20DRAFT_582734 [Whalleya microplaca]
MKPEVHEELRPIYPNLPAIDDISRAGGFVKCRPMLDKAIIIETCTGEQRPKCLYRAVHDLQPHGGVMAKGHEINHTDPLFFQVQLQKHMNWNCCDPSPFMSVSGTLIKAVIIASVYEAWGCSVISIIKFKSSGPGWDHKKQRLWDAEKLVQRFQLKRFSRWMTHEYLLKDRIPDEAIIQRMSWEKYRDRLDPGREMRDKMKRRVKYKGDDKIERKRKTDEDKIERKRKRDEGKDEQVQDTEEVAPGEGSEKEAAPKKERHTLPRVTEFTLRV